MICCAQTHRKQNNPNENGANKTKKKRERYLEAYAQSRMKIFLINQHFEIVFFLSFFGLFQRIFRSLQFNGSWWLCSAHVTPLFFLTTFSNSCTLVLITLSIKNEKLSERVVRREATPNIQKMTTTIAISRTDFA